MLTTRAAKRDKTSAFGDLMFDILDEGKPIGSVVFDKKVLAAAITVDGKAYSVARAREQHNEMLHQALIRVMTGAEKPPPNPWALKDAAGRTLALGERRALPSAVARRVSSSARSRGPIISTATAANSRWARSASRSSSAGPCTWTCRANSMRPSRSSC
jgi:hypothetical protein